MCVWGGVGGREAGGGGGRPGGWGGGEIRATFCRIASLDPGASLSQCD